MFTPSWNTKWTVCLVSGQTVWHVDKCAKCGFVWKLFLKDKFTFFQIWKQHSHTHMYIERIVGLCNWSWYWPWRHPSIFLSSGLSSQVSWQHLHLWQWRMHHQIEPRVWLHPWLCRRIWWSSLWWMSLETTNFTTVLFKPHYLILFFVCYWLIIIYWHWQVIL